MGRDALMIATWRKKYSYDPLTGVLTHRRLGRRLGSPNHDGYLRFNAYPYGLRFVHVVAFAMTTGRVPVEVDHRNRRRDDNRWNNLREATRAQNNANSRKRTKLPKGVSFVSGGFKASITVGGRSHYIGFFKTVADASAAYCAEALKRFGEFASH